jgi:lysozyme family protein
MSKGIRVVPQDEAFRRMMAETFADEGGFSNLDADPGGKTMYGITEQVARDHGYEGDMEDLTRDQALEIYRQSYFEGPNYHLVAELSFDIAREVFDCGVNVGPARASSMLQRALNLLNRRGQDYDDISMDGQVGPKTAQALAAFLNKRGALGENIILKALLAQRGTYYMDLASADEKFEVFLNGWLAKRVDMRKLLDG